MTTITAFQRRLNFFFSRQLNRIPATPTCVYPSANFEPICGGTCAWRESYKILNPIQVLLSRSCPTTECLPGYQACGTTRPQCIPIDQPCATGGLRRRDKAFTPCRSGLEACPLSSAGQSPVLASQSVECLNTQADLESCKLRTLLRGCETLMTNLLGGGCLFPVPGGKQGVDCSSLPGVKNVQVCYAAPLLNTVNRSFVVDCILLLC